jgi:hypothetical protein
MTYRDARLRRRCRRFGAGHPAASHKAPRNTAVISPPYTLMIMPTPRKMLNPDLVEIRPQASCAGNMANSAITLKISTKNSPVSIIGVPLLDVHSPSPLLHLAVFVLCALLNQLDLVSGEVKQAVDPRVQLRLTVDDRRRQLLVTCALLHKPGLPLGLRLWR